jgi:hypothetical protein
MGLIMPAKWILIGFPAFVGHLFFATVVQGATLLKCLEGHLIVNKNGNISNTSIKIPTYFVYDDNNVLMTRSSEINAKGDLYIKRGDDGATFLDGTRILEATLITGDAINQFIIDKELKTAKWSAIGRPGTEADGTQWTATFQCVFGTSR